jgi:hypothetical protein
MEVQIFLIVLTTIRVQEMVETKEETKEDEDLSPLFVEGITPTISINIRREPKAKEKDEQTMWLDSPI